MRATRPRRCKNNPGEDGGERPRKSLLCCLMVCLALVACTPPSESDDGDAAPAADDATDDEAWIGLATMPGADCEDFQSAPPNEQEFYAVMVLLDLWDSAGAVNVPPIELVDDWTATLTSTCSSSGETLAFITGAVMWTGYRGKYQP